jgi:hypothetical protein
MGSSEHREARAQAINRGPKLAWRARTVLRHMLPMLSLTQGHSGVADVFIVTRVGTAIKADSAHTQRFPYNHLIKGPLRSGAVSQRL